LNVFETVINAVSFWLVFQALFILFLTAQWLLWHTGSWGFARVFDYDLYRRTQAWLLCMFVPSPMVPLH